MRLSRVCTFAYAFAYTQAIMAHLLQTARMGVLLLWTVKATATLQAFTEESMEFQRKMVANGGLGQETYLPEGALQMSKLLLR